MTDPDAQYGLVEGVYDTGRGEGFKWSSEQFHVHLTAADLTHADLSMHYWVVDKILKTTGPLRITIAINGQPFDTFLETTDGERRYHHPAGAFTSSQVRPLDVAVTIHPASVSNDGTKLGILLESVGFTARP